MSSSPQDTPCPRIVGHRGASAEFPENTLASFEAAIREGACGIESDIHLSRDGRILCTHDATLDRGTTGTGLLRDKDWEGESGMKHVRTLKSPVQPIPLFEELLDLLMLPQNRHVQFWIDVKVTSDPNRLFPILAHLIDQHPSIKPRLIICLWHPSFLLPSFTHLPPPIRRFHVGSCTLLAREWLDYIDGVSMWFSALVTTDGALFRAECAVKGKEIGVWTVNDRREMAMALEWGVSAILTDVPTTAMILRQQSSAAASKADLHRELGLNPWRWQWQSKYWASTVAAQVQKDVDEIVREGGPLEDVLPLPPMDKIRQTLLQHPAAKEPSLIPVTVVEDLGDVPAALRLRA